MADPTPPAPTGLNAVHEWCGGKSHFVILVSIGIGTAITCICIAVNRYDALWPFLSFLAGMSGVQITRSIKEDNHG
jgi:hypothetical protein